MPAKSEKQQKMIYAKRDQYGSEANTPDKWKWVWGKEWGKTEAAAPAAEIPWNTFKNEDEIPGGKGDDTDPSTVDQDQLAVGIEVEREHTDTEEKAREIALDHLTEKPDYYTELVKAGLVDEKAALDKYNELFGDADVNEGKLRRAIREMVITEAGTSWADIGQRDKQARFDKALKSGKASFEDKLDAFEGGLTVKGFEGLKPADVRALRNLLKYMPDDMQLQLNKLDGRGLIKFLGNIRSAL